ncbi:protein HIDE1 isoform X2 [Sceloporus undulatus]|uniref:protein HIDE1 isoform X2 n=1 Tax=Sceloporus undulatus TaxID=8520 RepID=UPI001C4C2F37|nr:protein HIDE1 isoform X2 [Sceloporus undulatus]
MREIWVKECYLHNAYGSLGASSLFPYPLIFLNVLSDGLREGDSIKIACHAPMAYVDAWFYLYKVGQAQPFQILPAAETRHRVDFHLKNITTRDGGQYRCQYGQYNGSQLQLSELSFILEVTVEGSSLSTSAPTEPPSSDSEGSAGVLPIALSVTGVLLLVLILVVAVIAVGRLKERRQKKRVLDSCWTETNYPSTETSFDNCMFTVSVKNSGQEAVENHGTFSSTAMGTRFSSVRSVGKTNFSTFRVLE